MNRTSTLSRIATLSAPALLFASCVVAGPAGTGSDDPFRFGRTEWVEGGGCYIRDYSAEHLAAHPEQQVTRLMASFSPITTDADDGPTALAEIMMEYRKTASVATKGMTGGSFLCRDHFDDGRMICIDQLASDLPAAQSGGFAIVDVAADESITIETAATGASISGAAGLGNENDCLNSGKDCRPVRYKLFPQDAARCSVQ